MIYGLRLGTQVRTDIEMIDSQTFIKINFIFIFWIVENLEKYKHIQRVTFSHKV